MAQYPGSVPLTGYVAPKDTADSYAITDERFNRGGYRTVADLTERDNITNDRRKEGMLVYVLSEDKCYQLKGGTDNTNWVEGCLGGGSGSLTRNFVELNTDTTITDEGVYFIEGQDLVMTINASNDIIVRLKVMDGNITVVNYNDDGKIDGAVQELNIGDKGAVELLCRSNGKIYIQSLY